jgi:hypothetical protein
MLQPARQDYVFVVPRARAAARSQSSGLESLLPARRHCDPPQHGLQLDTDILEVLMLAFDTPIALHHTVREQKPLQVPLQVPL